MIHVQPSPPPVFESQSADPEPTSGEERTRTIAVVSGKGGSGKTMIAAEIANVLDKAGHQVLIMDADTGTAGMTYYLALRLVKNTASGLSDVVRAKSPADPRIFDRSVQRVSTFNDTLFFGIGNHRSLYRDSDVSKLPALLSEVISNLKRQGRWMVVDCRGGIDDESVAVCKAADDIILVAETDTTSYQASQHVIDVLTTNDVASKLRGFILNKVFENPEVVARNLGAAIRAHYLGAVPFDFEATRAFLVGRVPNMFSPFGVHVWQGVHTAYPVVQEPSGRVWTNEDFRDVGLTNLDALRGGLTLSVVLAMLGTLWGIDRFYTQLFKPPVGELLCAAAILIGVLSGAEGFRRSVGRSVSAYVRAVSRVLGSRRYEELSRDD